MGPTHFSKITCRRPGSTSQAASHRVTHTWICTARYGDSQFPSPAIPSLAPVLCAVRLYRHLSGRKSLNSLCHIVPTKVSFIDQFSRICQYRLYEGKWQNDGFGRAYFLLERCVRKTYYPNHTLCSQFQSPRAAYPPYGHFILSLAGMQAYIRPIDPEIQAAEGE